MASERLYILADIARYNAKALTAPSGPQTVHQSKNDDISVYIRSAGAAVRGCDNGGNPPTRQPPQS